MDLGQYILRKAVRADSIYIHQIVKELAIYEKIPDAQKIDAKTFEEDGFGSFPLFHAFVAVEKSTHEIVGCAVYVFTYATFVGRCMFMEDLFVKPAHRKNGIGLGLFNLVAEAAVENNCSQLNFSVLDWNKPSIDFYNSLGATDVTEIEGWHNFQMDKTELEKLALIKSTKKPRVAA